LTSRVESGEVRGFLGPNGAGEWTTMRQPDYETSRTSSGGTASPPAPS
jgi:ABC-type multidrug transport system ATPase subunit